MHGAKRSTSETRLRILNVSKARSCRCALKRTARPVYGHGNMHAEILFIGEAPGKKEDQHGIPFVGAAGNFLGEMLASIGLGREDVYVTNVVKYRPPDNRDPSPAEIEDCAEWLVQEIALIDPILIVTLGRHALNRFFPDMKISETHGNSFIATVSGIGRRTFLPLYHPAAALYNGSMRSVLKADFLRMPKILEKARSKGSSRTYSKTA